MPAYDVRNAFERIEHELIDSMMRNLRKYHLDEEDVLGFDWMQWQVEQLKNLEAYREKNLKKFGPQFRQINRRIGNAIKHGRANGQKEEEQNILKMLKDHPELAGRIGQFRGSVDIIGGNFFKINESKLEALLKATEHDLTKAEHAVLRRCNDQYRQIIFDAQVYANTGAGTVEKAVDMATHDFLSHGIDSIVYKNGARHTIRDYADMYLRTAERRAYLMGAGEKRKEWGLDLVIVNRRGTMTGGNYGHACPHCIPWLGKILIDDVYSGGKPDGEHKLVSTAMQEGFLHPRCRDTFTTYFPGITSKPDPVTKKELKEGERQEKREAREQYAERQAEKYERLAEYSLDPENQQKYKARAEEWSDTSSVRDRRLPNNELGIITDDLRDQSSKQHDVIKPRHIYNNLQKTDIGKEAWRIIQNNGTKIIVKYGVDPRDKNGILRRGYYSPADNEIVIFGDYTKRIDITAQTLIHEAYHGHDKGWKATQKSELFCMIMEKRHSVGGRSLTRAELNDILNSVKALYPELPWR